MCTTLTNCDLSYIVDSLNCVNDFKQINQIIENNYHQLTAIVINSSPNLEFINAIQAGIHIIKRFRQLNY